MFGPGVHEGAFRVDFAGGQSVRWTLSPENSPTTTVNAYPSASQCPDTNNFACVRNCEATMASPCAADFGLDWDYCMADCLYWYEFGPGCDAQWRADFQCVGNVGPAAENWHCDTNYDYVPRPLACDEKSQEALDCALGM